MAILHARIYNRAQCQAIAHRQIFNKYGLEERKLSFPLTLYQTYNSYIKLTTRSPYRALALKSPDFGLHLLSTRLGVPNRGLNSRSSFVSNVTEVISNFLQSPARFTGSMGEATVFPYRW
jgi:hypothetical protein